MKFGNLLATYYEERRTQMELGCASSTTLQEVPLPTKLYEPRDTGDTAQGLHQKSESVNDDRQTSHEASDLDCVASTSSRSSSIGLDYPHSPVVTASWRTQDNNNSLEGVIRTDKPKSYWRATEEEERARENGEIEQRRCYNSGEHNHQQQTNVVNRGNKVARCRTEAEKGNNKKPVRFWLGSDTKSDEQHADSIKTNLINTHVNDSKRDESVCKVVGEGRELCNDSEHGTRIDNNRRYQYHGMFQVKPLNYDSDRFCDSVCDKNVDTSRQTGLIKSEGIHSDYESSRYNESYRENYNNYHQDQVLVN